MNMYVANGTHQSIDFQYRLPEVRNYRQQNIPEGGQIRISGNLSQKDIDKIIECHEIYGLIDYRELPSRRGLHTMYIFNIGEPVPVSAIQELIIHNRAVNDETGRIAREEAAVALHKVIQDNTTDRLKSLEFNIEEKATNNRDGEVRENITVTKLPERGASQDRDKPTIRRTSAF
jgi:hypothetical protein